MHVVIWSVVMPRRLLRSRLAVPTVPKYQEQFFWFVMPLSFVGVAFDLALVVVFYNKVYNLVA